MTHAALLKTLRARIQKLDSQTLAARQLGISKFYLNHIIHERREISANVADALGYERVVMFKAHKKAS